MDDTEYLNFLVSEDGTRAFIIGTTLEFMSLSKLIADSYKRGDLNLDTDGTLSLMDDLLVMTEIRDTVESMKSISKMKVDETNVMANLQVGFGHLSNMRTCIDHCKGLIKKHGLHSMIVEEDDQ